MRLDLQGITNANGSRGEGFDETIQLTPLGLLALAEAFRRLVPLARARGLIPEIG